ncbi:MAG: hypothetical protein EBQ92_04900 [Proteobacteria bacterium]|nr:hypothetical protein [Pseudomonadota bacterium]
MKALKLLHFLAWSVASFSFGSQAQNFGLDAQSTGRAGSVTAEEKNDHAALYNPALLGTKNQSGFSFSTFQVEVKVDDFDSVFLPRSLRKTDDPVKDRLQLSAQSQTRWALGFNQPLRLKALGRQAGFGLSFSGPFEKLRGFVAHAPDDFFTARYGTADAQFKGTASLGLELIPKTLYVGTGLSLFLSGAGAAETTLSSNPTSRMNLDVVLEKAPVVGLYAKSGSYSSALTYHQKIDPILEQAVKAKVRINGRDTFEQPVVMRSSLYFEPRTIDWDLQQKGNHLLWSIGLSYQLWGEYQPPVLYTETPDLTGTTHRTSGGKPPTRDTLNPRASVGIPLGATTLASLGYQYRPTPFSDLSGISNALDTDTHILGMALEQHFSDSWILGTPVNLGVFGQIHRFKDREISKTARPGSPASTFTYTGNALVVGVSAQAEL